MEMVTEFGTSNETTRFSLMQQTLDINLVSYIETWVFIY